MAIKYEMDVGWTGSVFIAGARLRDTETNIVISTFSSSIGTTIEDDPVEQFKVAQYILKYSFEYFDVHFPHWRDKL